MAVGAPRHGADLPGGTTRQSRSRSKSGEHQAEIARAIAAAEQAGLQSYRIERAPDGTITIIVGMAPE